MDRDHKAPIITLIPWNEPVSYATDNLTLPQVKEWDVNRQWTYSVSESKIEDRVCLDESGTEVPEDECAKHIAGIHRSHSELERRQRLWEDRHGKQAACIIRRSHWQVRSDPGLTV